jgi:hypothetical protein
VVTTSDLSFPVWRSGTTMCGAPANVTERNDMPTTEDSNALPEAGDCELIEVTGNRIRVITASASQLVCDHSAAPLFPGPPLHVHPGFDETYLVLEGRLQLTERDERWSRAWPLMWLVRCRTRSPIRRLSGSASSASARPVASSTSSAQWRPATAQAIAEISERFGCQAVEFAQ